MFESIDDFIIDRVFQPVVNRFELDPDITVRNLIAGVIVTTLTQGFMLWRKPFLAVITLLPMITFIGAWRAGKFMPRLGHASLRCLFSLLVLFLVGNDISDLVHQIEPVALLALVGHLLLIVAFYVAACSKPPPRRKRAPVWAVSTT